MRDVLVALLLTSMQEKTTLEELLEEIVHRIIALEKTVKNIQRSYPDE